MKYYYLFLNENAANGKPKLWNVPVTYKQLNDLYLAGCNSVKFAQSFAGVDCAHADDADNSHCFVKVSRQKIDFPIPMRRVIAKILKEQNDNN